MAVANSTTTRKPKKPHPDFPLFPHASGKWAKKVRGKMHYFGRWEDPQAALESWLEVKDDLLAGRKPRPKSANGLTLADAANDFLAAMDKRRKIKGLTQRNWDDKRDALEFLVGVVNRDRFVEDLDAEDFVDVLEELNERFGKASQFRFIAHIRSMGKWLLDNGRIDRPIRFGSDFKCPSEKEMITERDQKGERYFQPELVRELLAEPKLDRHMQAFILLTINCGIGNSDIGRMQSKHVDLDGGWLDYPRGKTNVARRAKLWTETVEAIGEALAEQRKGRRKVSCKDLLFVDQQGLPFVDPDGEMTEKRRDVISPRFKRALVRLGKYEPCLTFYVLRSTFRTVTDNIIDDSAVDLCMGHKSSKVGRRRYRSHLPDEAKRLEAVADHVHRWLFGSK